MTEDHPAGAETAEPVGRLWSAHHWHTFVSRWPALRPPIRPHPADVRLFETCVEACRRGPLAGLLLGVTPELASMRWPERSRFVSVDRSIEAVRRIWTRGHALVPASVVLAEWERMPLADGSVDVVVGDGCLTALGPAPAQIVVLRELMRVLKPGGRFIQRLFAAPEVREDPAVVLEDVRQQRIGVFDAFKWRLLMATPAGADQAVRVGDAYEIWAGSGIDPGWLARVTGWPRAHIDTFEHFRNSDARLGFAPVSQVLALLEPFFDLVEVVSPKGYELAEQCPIIVMERR